MKTRIVVSALFIAALVLPCAAFAQGMVAPGHVLGNGSTSNPGAISDYALSSVMDQALCTTLGDVPLRGSSVWGCGTPFSVFGNQSANLVFSGPGSGSPALPGFRSLVGADVPPIALGTVGTNGGINGTLAIGNGGTGLTSFGPGVQSALGNAVNGSNGLLTYGILGTSGATVPLLNGTNTWSATQTFPNNSLTLAELPQLNAGSFWANPTGSTANAEQVTLGSTLNWSGTTVNCTPGSTSQLGCYTIDGVTLQLSGGKLTAVGAAATSVDASGATTISNGTANTFLFDNAGKVGGAALEYNDNATINWPNTTTVQINGPVADMLTDVRMARGLSLTTSGRVGYPTSGNEYKGVYTGFVTSTDGLESGQSSNALYDTVNKVQSPDRVNQSSVYGTSFSSLSGWTVSGNVTSITTGLPAPLANAADFVTGATIGTAAQIQQNVGSVPASFGISFVSNNVAIGNNTADAINIQVGNTDGYSLEIRINDNSIAIFIDGAFTQIFAASLGNFPTEMWLQADQNSGNNYTVSLYLGTQYIASLTGTLPSGGTNGLVTAYLIDGATASRQAYLYFLNIGSSALPANMTLVGSLMQENTTPSLATVMALVEDDAESIVPGTTLFVDVTCNGSTYTNVSDLADVGIVSQGLVDNTKNVSAYAGSVALSGCTTGANLGWRLRTQPQATGTESSVFSPIWGVALQAQ